MPKTRKTDRSAATYRKIIQAGNRTVRVAAYPPRDNQTTGVTLGIGYADPDAFAKIFFEITPENWKEVQTAVKQAFAAADGKDAVIAVKEIGVKPTKPARPKPRPKPVPATAAQLTGSRNIGQQAAGE